jgi:hypothetical protein
MAESVERMTKQAVNASDVKRVTKPDDYQTATALSDEEELKAKKAKAERERKERERLMRMSFTC